MVLSAPTIGIGKGSSLALSTFRTSLLTWLSSMLSWQLCIVDDKCDDEEEGASWSARCEAFASSCYSLQEWGWGLHSPLSPTGHPRISPNDPLLPAPSTPQAPAIINPAGSSNRVPALRGHPRSLSPCYCGAANVGSSLAGPKGPRGLPACRAARVAPGRSDG